MNGLLISAVVTFINFDILPNEEIKAQMTGPILDLSATEIAARTNAGKLRSEDIARWCLARIEAREPTVRAWSFIDPDFVLKQARALDAKAYEAPLRGVPVGVKDLIETCDMPTEMGSPIYRG
jgi:Asp-tRNA(Asn)/Glu-tRNA(Gln) amidotransferase A subunit family amidase